MIDTYPRAMSRVSFHILDVQARDIETDTNKELVIQLFGMTEQGQRIRCNVTGFQPIIYLRLPEKNTSSAADSIKTYIESEGVPMNTITMERVTKKNFYGFTAETLYPFLQLTVTSLTMFRRIRGLFLNEHMKPHTKKYVLKTPIEVFEANFDPMLRFFHTQNISPCGWVSAPCPKKLMEQPSLAIECEYDDILPESARIPAPFVSISWDIECFSHTGDFPVAIRTWKKLAKDLVGPNKKEQIMKYLSTVPCTILKPHLLEKKLNAMDDTLDTVEDLEEFLSTLTMVTLKGDPVIQIGSTIFNGKGYDSHIFVFPDCAPIPSITVHAYPTETEMIVAWYEWIAAVNPDILIGYNIFGFDESYLWERSEELGIIHANSIVHNLTRLREDGEEVRLEEKNLSSSAMGDNTMYIWTMHGRLQIDMFHYIKRNNTLGSYKLDEVTKHFMSGKLNGIHYEAGVLTLDISGSVTVGKSIQLLDETGESCSPKLYVTAVEKGKITVVIDEEMDLNDATKWVVVKDDVSPADIFRLHRGSAEDRAIVAKYCIQDCNLVIELYKKLETFNNSMSMANVCSVPISYIFVRGQGIKAESLIFKYCREKGVIIPVLEQPRDTDESYEGAIVLDPEPGFYSTSPIGVCDFASLYPSTIVSENISHDSLVWIKDFTYEGGLIKHQWGSEEYDGCEGYAFTDIEYDILRPDPADHRKNPVKIRCGRRICRFAQPLDGSKSTLPQITQWLLRARSAKKKEMKSEKDPERYALLDAEQLAYKLTGNSLYGQLGSPTFKIRLQALAASVTAYGRKQILFAKDAIELFYGPGADPRCAARCMAKVVYGDSVSPDTLITIRVFQNHTYRIRIEELEYLITTGSTWLQMDSGKEYYEVANIESWTESGWTPIKRIIRHYIDKPLYRTYIKTNDIHIPYIDVTGDHSLIMEDGTEITPKELKPGMRLLTTDADAIFQYMEILPYQGFVYDLTTENHHFQAGPYGLIVHNTDSLFVAFNPRNPDTGERLEGRDARQATIDITDEAGHFITNVLKPPHDFEFDKCFDPLLMFSKKRYAGNMYENNADDYVHKYMGIALKRRDNAPIVKTIFGGAMKMLLDKRDVVGATAFVKDKCMELIDGRISLSQLIVTKSLRDSYANPESIAHKVLADRITERDPGNAPASGDRIGYIYIRPKPGQIAAELQGDRIETPQFIREHKLEPDYKHYIEHQLQNPVSQAFGILLESMPGFHPSWVAKCPPLSNLDAYLGFREAKAGEILFTECLRRFEVSATRTTFQNLFPGGTVSKRAKTTNPVVEASLAIVASATKGAPVQRKISGFLLDSHIVSTNDKRRAKKAKEDKE